MQIAPHRLRLYYFLTLYVGVFAMLAIIGYYVAGKAGMVNRHDTTQKFVSDPDLLRFTAYDSGSEQW